MVESVAVRRDHRRGEQFHRLPADGRGNQASIPSAAYLHVYTNETIHGVEIRHAAAYRRAAGGPTCRPHILSGPVPVVSSGLIYAGAQRTSAVGPDPGRRPSRPCSEGRRTIPTVMDFRGDGRNGSMLNTPPTYGIYIAGLVFQWLKRRAGWRHEAASTTKRRGFLRMHRWLGRFLPNPVDGIAVRVMNVPFTGRSGTSMPPSSWPKPRRRAFSPRGIKSVGGMRFHLQRRAPGRRAGAGGFRERFRPDVERMSDDLQKELAGVRAEIDGIDGELASASTSARQLRPEGGEIKASTARPGTSTGRSAKRRCLRRIQDENGGPPTTNR